jgi:hypothetical protein
MSYLTRNLNQTAVYWGSPTPDGWGGTTFDSPVEMDCRWEEKQELFVDASGEQVLSHAVVYLSQDVDIGGYLYLGDMNDLDSTPVPSENSDAYEIRSFRKTPNLKATVYERKAWL